MKHISKERRLTIIQHRCSVFKRIGIITYYKVHTYADTNIETNIDGQTVLYPKINNEDQDRKDEQANISGNYCWIQTVVGN